MHAHVFCTFGTDLYAQSVIINNIAAWELSQKFIKSGWVWKSAQPAKFWWNVIYGLLKRKRERERENGHGPSLSCKTLIAEKGGIALLSDLDAAIIQGPSA